MTILRKDKELTVRLGTPGTPGSPGVPATRGHYENVPVTTTYWVAGTPGQTVRIPVREVGLNEAGVGEIIYHGGKAYVEDRSSTFFLTVTSPGTSGRMESETRYERRWVPGTKAIPAVPAKPGTPTTIEWLYNEGWDKGYAVSIAPVGENESVEFQVPDFVRGVFVGLAARSAYGQAISAYAVGVMADATGIWVHERGRNVQRLADNIDTSWTTRIRRDGERVTYRLYAPDGAIAATYESEATIPIEADIHAFGYLYRGDDEIRDAAIVSSAGIVAEAGLHGVAELTGFPLPLDRPPGADSASWMRAKATMSLRPSGARLRARGRIAAHTAGVKTNRWGRINGKLPRLAAKLAYTKKFGEINAILPRLAGRLGASHIPPRRQTIDLYLMGIAFSGIMSKSKAGRIEGTLPRLAAKLSDNKSFGEIDANLPPVLGSLERDRTPNMGWLFASAIADDRMFGAREQTAFFESRALLGDEYRNEGVERISGVGAVTIPPLTIAGLASFSGPVGGAGSVNIPALTVRGSGAYLAPIVGFGAVNLPPVKISASARYAPNISGVGAVNLPSLTVRGVGRNASPVVGAGDVTLPPIDVRGQGVYRKLPAGCELTHCGMTGLALIRRFRELSQDEVEPYLWEDCFVLDMLNEAEREAADRAKLLYDDSLAVAVTVKAGKARYAIDPHIIDIERAALTADGDRRPLLLKLFDRMELDWKTPPRSKHEAGLPWGRPFGLVFDGKHEVEIVPGPRRDGRLLLGVHRLPWADFDMDAEPEIPCIHHASLVDWALFRAFSIPDADEANEQLATFYLDRFEKYFGRRIDARKRRLQRANKPHTNKLW